MLGGARAFRQVFQRHREQHAAVLGLQVKDHQTLGIVKVGELERVSEALQGHDFDDLPHDSGVLAVLGAHREFRTGLELAAIHARVEKCGDHLIGARDFMPHVFQAPLNHELEHGRLGIRLFDFLGFGFRCAV